MNNDNSVLERLVEHILLELLAAQNASNEASAKLAESYLKPNEDGIPYLEFFPVPNSSIKSFDFNLKFALKDIRIILTDDAISKINKLIQDLWLTFLDNLFNGGAILERRKKSLLKITPILDYNSVETKAQIETDKEESIASFLEKEIVLLFIGKLPRRARKKKDVIAKSTLPLNIREKINTILFESDKEQSIPLPDVKAIFDVGKLNNASGEIICGINVHVEMRNFDSAYYNVENKEGNAESKLKLLTLK